MTRRIGLPVYIGIIIALLIGVAAADNNVIVASAQSDLTTLSIEDLMNIEVTTASKKPEKVADAPASVYVITHDDIERYGYRTLQEALRRIVGLYVSSDRNYDYLGVRGYARPGDYNTRILLLIDGLRTNDPMYSSSSIGDDLSVDIRSVERIEIVKGPGSALWGTNAMLAVVNLIMRKASDIDGNQLIQEYGSDSTTTSFFEFGGRNPQGLEFAGSATTIESQGQNSIYFPDIKKTAVGVDGEVSQHGYISGSYKGINFFVTTGKYRKTIPTGSYGNVFNDERNYTEDTMTIAALSYERKVSPKNNGDFFVRLYSSSRDYNGDYIYDLGNPTLVVNKDIGSAKWWGAEARYSSQLNSKFSFVSGIEYTDVNKIHLQNYFTDPYYLMNLNTKSSNTLCSWYLQTDYDLSRSLRLVSGARMDNYSIYGKSWSPRCGLVKKLDDSSNLKLLWGKAFRASDGYENDYTKAITGNPYSNLTPEEITTTEMVWDKGLSSRTRLITSIYRFDLKDIITQIGQVQFENSGMVRSEGIESQLDYRLQDGTTAYLNATFLNAEDTDTNQRISNSPRLLAGAGISLSVLSDKLYVTPEVQLIGSRMTLAGNEIGSSAVVNLSVSTHNYSNAWSTSISAYNLFNTAVYIPGGMEHTQDIIPQEGRTLIMETSYHF